MKSSHWFVLATAVAGSAVACGLYLLRQPATSQAIGADASQPQSPTTVRRAALTPDGTARGGALRKSAAASRRSDMVPAAPRAAEPRKILGSPPTSGQGVMPEAQWLAHAAKVEQEANHEVNRLASLLDLNSAQQDQLFAMLARRSTSWLPGMTTNQGSLGSVTTATEATVASADDELVAYLNADQQQTLIQEEMDRQAWWEEMLPQLLPPQLDGTTGTETLTPSTGSDAPETKPYEGGEMLLED